MSATPALGGDPPLVRRKRERHTAAVDDPQSTKRHKGKAVLREDVYVATLSEVIARDYYPTVPRQPTEDALNLPSTLRLDAFQSLYTSEDNSSFSAIMDTSAQSRKERYRYLHTPAPLLLEGPAKWKFEPKNALMYLPEGVEKARGKGHDGKAITAGRVVGQREIVRENTAVSMADDNEEEGKDVRNVSGTAGSGPPPPYDLIPSTPSLQPGKDAPHVFTWGSVSATPRPVPANETPKAFRIPETPRREALGLVLSSKAAKSLQRRMGVCRGIGSHAGSGGHSARGSSARGHGEGGWSTTPRRGTPSGVRLATGGKAHGSHERLSEAAKRLLRNAVGRCPPSSGNTPRKRHAPGCGILSP